MPSGTAGRPPTVEELREAVAALIGAQPGAIADDANLALLGIDSFGMMRLVNHLRKEGMQVSLREMVAEPTLVAWQRHIESLSKESRST
jgi:aryl carrier-like protein